MDDGSVATDHESKADAFIERFFPDLAVTAASRQALQTLASSTGANLTVLPEATDEKFATVLNATGKWKAAGRDDLPNGLL